jgi:hypothetical protein
MRTYLGLMLDCSGRREIFRSEETPTRDSHGSQYAAVIGPFKTVRAAKFMRDYGRGNPHCLCVADAEKLSKLHTAE